VIEHAGPGVERWHPGHEVIGFTNRRASHAELVVVDAENLTPRPPAVPWDAAGALFIAGATAWAAVRAVGASAGDVVVISAAAGGVGTVAVQLARNAGATVIGLASEPHHGWLRDHGAIPVSYGEGAVERIRAAAESQVDALIHTFGSGYVDLGNRPRRQSQAAGRAEPRGASVSDRAADQPVLRRPREHRQRELDPADRLASESLVLPTEPEPVLRRHVRDQRHDEHLGL
jgi:threonine dehydrogenase-like Zn-dependent dehydrogenase